MPAPQLGAIYEVPVPDVAQQLELGFTTLRIYWAESEDGAEALAASLPLVAGTFNYVFNKPDAAATDWAEHCFFGSGGESARSERVPVSSAAALVTKKRIRQGVGRKLRLLDVVTVTSAADTDEFVSAQLIDADASPRRHANRFARVSSGSQAGSIRRVRDSLGYTPATGRIEVGRPFASTLQAGDEVELWRPKGDEDPSVMIDEAMNDARHLVWWEEDIYIVTQHGVTDYRLPGYIEMESQVKSVLFAANTYPDQPQWTTAGRAEPRRLGGSVWLTSVEGDALTRWQLSEGTVLQVIVNRSGDSLGDDDDSWDGCPSLEWAIAETAREFLMTLGSPSGGFEDIIDVDRALAKRENECARYRRLYLPSAAARVELAK